MELHLDFPPPLPLDRDEPGVRVAGEDSWNGPPILIGTDGDHLVWLSAEGNLPVFFTAGVSADVDPYGVALRPVVSTNPTKAIVDALALLGKAHPR